MVSISLPDELVDELTDIAQSQNRPLSDVVAAMISHYKTEVEKQQESDAEFAAMFGIYDDDVTYMSTTVRETIRSHFEKKHGRTD
jgi:metal-responsive CopG/Arc/MetJ family transcriptional regulator